MEFLIKENAKRLFRPRHVFNVNEHRNFVRIENVRVEIDQFVNRKLIHLPAERISYPAVNPGNIIPTISIFFSPVRFQWAQLKQFCLHFEFDTMDERGSWNYLNVDGSRGRPGGGSGPFKGCTIKEQRD